MILARTISPLELTVRTTRQFYINAGGGVTLSAEEYRSPQLLMLSGVANSEALTRHDILTQIQLPSERRISMITYYSFDVENYTILR